MKKIIILLLLITVIIPNAFGQEGITLTKDNKAYYRLTVSGNRSHDNGPLGVDCDYGIKEIRFLDKNNKTVKTIDADGKHGVFSYDTENQQFTKNQFPVKIHIDNDFNDRLLCKGWLFYDGLDSWFTDRFRDESMDVIKVEYGNACYPQGYSGFWKPDHKYYGGIFYMTESKVYMHDLKVKSNTVVQIKTPKEPLYLASDEYITIALPDNLLDGYSYYWRYQVGSGRYNNIPSKYITAKNGKKVLRIKGKEFLNETAYGKRVRLELVTQCKTSNPVSFTYYPSAPRVTKIETTNPICYKGDGEVKIVFNRNLKTIVQEKLTVNLKDNLGIKYSSGVLTSFKKESTDTYSYTFKGVKEGNYTIEFAGGNMKIGGQIISTVIRDPKDPVNIVDPSQIVFSISSKNSSCNDNDNDPNNNNDGEITINVEGGSDGIYQYSIQKVGDTSSLRWYDFKKNNSHIIKNVQPEQYEVRVQKKQETSIVLDIIKIIF